MPTRVYIYFLTFILAFCVLGIGSVFAQQYTTKSRTNTATQASSSSKAVSRSSSKAQVDKCTIQDVRAIKKFDRIAKRNLIMANKEEEFSDTASKAAQKYAKERVKAVNFFSSAEYFQMKPVYLRCGKEIPVLQIQSSFWVPDEMGGSCPTCPK